MRLSSPMSAILHRMQRQDGEVVGWIIQLKGVAVFAGNNDAAVPESNVERPQGTAQSMQIAHQTLIINYTSLTIYKVENDISH
jgi:hypothetical protein